MVNRIEEIEDDPQQLSASKAAPGIDSAEEHPLRIAVASSNGERVDRHFGQTDDLWIFDVTAAGHKIIEVRNIDANVIGEEDRRQTIYRLVADCKAMLIVKIGATPLQRLAALGIEGIDKHANATVDTALRDVYNARTSGVPSSTLKGEEAANISTQCREETL